MNYVVLLDFNPIESPQACYGPTSGTDCAAQSQVFSLEEAMALAKYLNLKEPGCEYTVHEMLIGKQILEKP